ncbi:MAG: ABC transporter permease [Planctomycetes bacterium]|nr:ABC transporter permease [Planctomycetota bacterium]
MRTVLIIAGKDLLLAWRDRFGFIWWMITFPLLIAVLVGLIFASVLGGVSKVTAVAVVDEADSPASRAFAAAVNEGGMLHLTRTTRSAARDAVRRGKMAAFIEVPADFEVSPGLLFGDPLPIALGVDPARRSEAMFIEAALYEAAMALLRQEWMDPATRPRLIETWVRERHGTLSPLERGSLEAAIAVVDRLALDTRRDFVALGRSASVARQGPVNRGPASRAYSAEAAASAAKAGPAAPRERLRVIPVAEAEVRPRSSFEVCFPLGILWGLLGLAAEFAIANVRERDAGTLQRLRVAPIGRWQILLGNGLAAFVACLGVVLFLLAVGRVAFGVRLQNMDVLAMAVVSTALCLVGVTLLLSVLGKTESAVGGAAWAFLLVMAMLGGGMVPQMFLPGWMDTAGNVSFVKWAIRALEGGIWREFTVGEAAWPCAILLVQGVACGAVGLMIGSRRERF